MDDVPQILKAPPMAANDVAGRNMVPSGANAQGDTRNVRFRPAQVDECQIGVPPAIPCLSHEAEVIGTGKRRFERKACAGFQQYSHSLDGNPLRRRASDFNSFARSPAAPLAALTTALIFLLGISATGARLEDDENDEQG